MGRGPARQRPTGNNPDRPIANIFVPTGYIGGRGRGQERVGRGKRLQGSEGGGRRGRRGRRKRGMERGSDATSDAETEEDDWGHAPLTASPRGTQSRVRVFSGVRIVP